MIPPYCMIEPIDGVRQIGAHWCWAASTQMLSGYYDTKLTSSRGISQCDVVSKYLNRTLRTNRFSCGFCLTGNPNIPVLRDCNVYLFMSEFKDLLSIDFNLESALVNSTAMSFNDIRKQIYDNEQALIAAIVEVSDLCDTFHVVAVKGYADISGYLFLIILDPARPEPTGRLRLIAYNDSNANVAFRFCSFISDIRFETQFFKVNGKKSQALKRILPKKKLLPQSMDEKLVLALAEQFTKDIKYIENNTVPSKNAMVIPVRYISRNKIESILEGKPMTLDQVSSDTIINVLITDTGKLKSETTVQLVEGKWKVLNIEQSRHLIPKDILVESLKINISNEGFSKFIDTHQFLQNFENQANKAVPQAHFEIVKFSPFIYEFYRFGVEKNFYWIPLNNYPDLDMIKGKVYTENTALQLLRTQSLNFFKEFGKFIK